MDSKTDGGVVVGKYKVKIDRNTCIGDAVCVGIAPNTFVLDSANKSTVKSGSMDSLEILKTAAQACPTQSISIFDAATGEKVWPK